MIDTPIHPDPRCVVLKQVMSLSITSRLIKFMLFRIRAPDLQTMDSFEFMEEK